MSTSRLLVRAVVLVACATGGGEGFAFAGPLVFDSTVVGIRQAGSRRGGDDGLSSAFAPTPTLLASAAPSPETLLGLLETGGFDGAADRRVRRAFAGRAIPTPRSAGMGVTVYLEGLGWSPASTWNGDAMPRPPGDLSRLLIAIDPRRSMAWLPATGQASSAGRLLRRPGVTSAPSPQSLDPVFERVLETGALSGLALTGGGAESLSSVLAFTALADAPSASAVPEPSTAGLLLLGALLRPLARRVYRRRLWRMP